jgi:hypothetical protein
VRGRALALSVNVVTIHHESEFRSEDGNLLILPTTRVAAYLAGLQPLNEHTFKVLNSVPLYFRAPLAPASCAHSNQPYVVAPAAAPWHAARSCTRRGVISWHH